MQNEHPTHPTSRETTEHVRDREVVVIEDGPTEDPGLAPVVAALLIVAAMVFVVWAVLVAGGGTGDSEAPIPDEVDVNINDGGDSGSQNTGGENSPS